MRWAIRKEQGVMSTHHFLSPKLGSSGYFCHSFFCTRRSNKCDHLYRPPELIMPRMRFRSSILMVVWCLHWDMFRNRQSWSSGMLETTSVDLTSVSHSGLVSYYFTTSRLSLNTTLSCHYSKLLPYTLFTIFPLPLLSLIYRFMRLELISLICLLGHVASFLPGQKCQPRSSRSTHHGRHTFDIISRELRTLL